MSGAGKYWATLTAAVAVAMAVSGLPALAETDQGYTPPAAAGPQVVKYPSDAQRSGEEGTVVVQVYVNTEGQVRRARLVRSSGHDRLDNAALESVYGWHFNPAKQNGAMTSGWANVQVVYKIPEGAQ